MTKNPFLNALVALTYIVGLVSLVLLTPGAFGAPKESIIYPMVMLALLVLSVTLMAFFFFYQPVTLLLDGQRERAVTFFLKTVGTFALGTVMLLLVALLVGGASGQF